MTFSSSFFCISCLITFCRLSQVISFAMEKTAFVDFQKKSTIAFEHILFNDWDATHETLPYPPAIGQYALYKTKDVISHIDSVMTNVSSVTSSCHPRAQTPPHVAPRTGTSSRCPLAQAPPHVAPSHRHLLTLPPRTGTSSCCPLAQAPPHVAPHTGISS